MQNRCSMVISIAKYEKILFFVYMVIMVLAKAPY